MTSNNKNKFKGLVGTIGGLLTIFIALQPYFNLVAENKNQQSQINLLIQKQEIDHDTLIRMSSDIIYIRETVKELKGRK